MNIFNKSENRLILYVILYILGRLLVILVFYIILALILNWIIGLSLDSIAREAGHLIYIVQHSK